MRIVSKIRMLTVVLGVFVLSEGMVQPVWGQTKNAVPPPALPEIIADATITNSSPSLAVPPAGTQPMPSFPALPTSDPRSTGLGSNLSGLENKAIPDSVKEVVKHLDRGTTEDVTLDDLNSARQAVAKIEALIDIEKHLVELDKVRQEREKKTPFASAIPASALQPPASALALPFGGGSPLHPGVVSSSPEKGNEILRVMGRNGHYSAVLKMPDEKTKTVEVGDQLADGSKVVAITATEVDLVHGSARQSIRIKNVETVFGGAS